MRFYVDYSADCGWALMNSHCVIEATDHKTALANWPALVRGRAAYQEQGPDACFPLPSFMAEWAEEKVLEHYRHFDFGYRREAVHRTLKMYAKLPDWKTFYHDVAPEDVTPVTKLHVFVRSPKAALVMIWDAVFGKREPRQAAE